ncbi:MAG: transporter substrate-binding domain-containing protein [Actinomycetota bacterium]
MSRRPSTAAALVALVATLAPACTGGGGEPSPVPDPVPVKIAFLHDMSVPDPAQTVAPALLGLQLALREALDRGGLPVIPEVIGLDVEGDDAKANELAQEVASDPSYVAAVIGPFWSEPASVGDLLQSAGIPTLSLSELDPALATQGWSSWRRVVAGVSRESSALAAAIRGSSRSVSGVCVVGDGSSLSGILGGLVTTSLSTGRVAGSVVLADEDALSSVVQRVDRAGCGAIAWTGFGTGATLLRTGLSEAGAGSVPMVGSSAMKTESYLSTTAGAGDGTIVTCACVDLGSSTRPEARRFIHDFQSQYGSPPGVFGPEGWDVGGMLLAAFRAGAVDRRTVAAALAASDGYEGLANTYRFDDAGELVSGAGVHVFRAEGVRWVPVGESDSEARLPVGIPGYLSVAACRKGRPYAYPVGGRLGGFGVELAAAIARRLGLTLSWVDLPCRTALRAVANGTLDAVLAPIPDVPQGTPTSGIVLSMHVALVTTRAQAHEQSGTTLLDRLGPHDVVAVVRSAETVPWANDTLEGTGAEVGITSDRRAAYEALLAGTVTAVADVEPEAWAAIERRRSLRVVQSVDVGAHDVFVAKGPDAQVVAAIDEALARLIRVGRYALLFAKYFPGTLVPPETGS